MTAILEAAGSKTLEFYGKRVSAKRILARMLWDIAATGKTVMPDGETELVLAPEEWLTLVRWIYQHIDGPPKAEMDITSGGQPVVLRWIGDEPQPGAEDSDG